MMRGMEMLQNGATISENGDGSFSVPSQTSGKTYEVRILGQNSDSRRAENPVQLCEAALGFGRKNTGSESRIASRWQ